MGVPDRQAADPTGEVDEAVAVDVGNDRTPSAEAITTGACTVIGAATHSSLRARISRERGPGISVTSWIADRIAGRYRSE